MLLSKDKATKVYIQMGTPARPLTDYIKDNRLTANIFTFAPSPALLQVNKSIKSIVENNLGPILVKDYIKSTELDLNEFRSVDEVDINFQNYPNASLQYLRRTHIAIKDYAAFHGNRAVKSNFLYPVPHVRQILQEDLTLVAFYKALQQAPGILKARTQAACLTTAHQIRTWMKVNQPLLEEVRHLDLSDKELEEIPKEIKYFKNLVVLNLSENKLTAIPREVCSLSKLTTVDLSYNKLPRLIKQFSDLKALVSLSAHNNLLTHFPKMLRSLPELRKLNLAFNQIGKIPLHKSDLPKLQQLDISFNKIVKLPKCLYDRGCTIDARGNELHRKSARDFESVRSKKPFTTY